MHAQYINIFIDILAEMYSFSMASAHFNLKHNLFDSMVSNPQDSTESWSKISWNWLNEFNSLDTNIHIIHYCHGYWLGDDRSSGHIKNYGFNFHKGHLPKDILHNCDIGLLVEPTINEISKNRDHTKDKLMLWMLHQVITKINDALSNYKHLYCKNWIPKFNVVLVQPEFDPQNRMHYFLDSDNVYHL